MRSLIRRHAAGAVVVTVLAVAFAPSGFAAVAVAGPAPVTGHKLVKSSRSFAGDVRHLPRSAPRSKEERPEREPPPTRLRPEGKSAPIGEGVFSGSLAPAPGPSSTFDGLHFNEDCGGVACGDGHPPDTNGDVGPRYYIQTVNTAVGIYDKSSGARVAGFSFNALMSQGNFGNLCDTDNFGDPVVLYDSFHDRWVITDFAFQLDASGNVVSPPGSYECFAVSRTGDPVAGGWSFYSLHITDYLQDYPKIGVWPDGLYMSANLFGFSARGSFKNSRVWALNLAQMEAGDATAQVVSFNAQSKIQGVSVFGLLPSNARLQAGTPPAGRPNYFTSVWGWTNRVRVWSFHVDWANTANSTFNGPTDSTTATSWASPPGAVPAKNGNDLDALGTRLMVQNQYTNLGGAESLWNSHTVQGSSASQAALRWYQVPVTNGSVGNAVQAASFNPDSANRFMPSLAVDRAANMAIGYSVSSSSLFPGIRYAGRLASDPPNTLGQAEASLIEGTGSQTGNCGGSPCERWGDYSAMTLDPDGCTFWYTNEYYLVSGLDDHTRIGSFRLPSCTSIAMGTLQGTVTESGTGNPISGATVTAGIQSTTTTAGGAYTFPAIPAGTYSVNVSAPDHAPSTANGVVVGAGGTTTRDFTLASTAAITYPGTIQATSGLVSYWRLGEGSGLVANDEQNLHDGSYVAGVTLGRPGAIAGDPDTAVGLSAGVNDYANLGDVSLGEGGAFSAEAWIKTTSTTTNRYILSEGSTTATTPIWGIAQDAGQVRAFYRNDAGTSGSVSSSATINDGSWHHVVMTAAKGGTLALYVDGVLQGTSTTPAGAITLNTTSIGLLRRATLGFEYNGDVDDVSVYSAALSGATVQQHYGAGL